MEKHFKQHRSATHSHERDKRNEHMSIEITN